MDSAAIREAVYALDTLGADGVTPSCFLNILLRCWGYSKPRRSVTWETVSPAAVIQCLPYIGFPAAIKALRIIKNP